jgi:hypothetical protein
VAAAFEGDEIVDAALQLRIDVRFLELFHARTRGYRLNSGKQ